MAGPLVVERANDGPCQDRSSIERWPEGVDPRGLEPLTYWLPANRSTS
jgi:hypothetical protein